MGIFRKKRKRRRKGWWKKAGMMDRILVLLGLFLLLFTVAMIVGPLSGMGLSLTRLLPLCLHCAAQKAASWAG